LQAHLQDKPAKELAINKPCAQQAANRNNAGAKLLSKGCTFAAFSGIPR